MPAKPRFNTEQIVAFLCEAEAGRPVKDLCETHGFSSASFYAWKTKYAPKSQVQSMSRLLELEALCNGLERKLYASRNEAIILKVVLRTMLRAVDRRRELVHFLKSNGLSERQALSIAGLSASSLRYQAKSKASKSSKSNQ
jgi:putative transposase